MRLCLANNIYTEHRSVYTVHISPNVLWHLIFADFLGIPRPGISNAGKMYIPIHNECKSEKSAKIRIIEHVCPCLQSNLINELH